MYQLLKIHIDESNPQTWDNLQKLPSYNRREWIKAHFNLLIKTLDGLKVSGDNALVPWSLIGNICINENLYAEAESIYDLLFKKIRDSHGNLGMPSYYRGIAKFLQGRFKEAYEDFKSAKQYDIHAKTLHSPSKQAISYMEETIFPTREIVKRNHDKLIKDINVSRQLEYKVGPNILRTLHKWNSSSPLYSRSLSQGGGYLLTTKNSKGELKGIAIDPGYDFFDLFRSIGLSIVDLDAIIITHDHDDHTESVEGILSLLAKYNDYNQERRSRVLDIFGSAGTLLKFHGLLSATDLFGNKEINFKLLVPGNRIKEIEGQSMKQKYGFEIKVTPAYHNELWTNQESAVGIILETNIKDKNGEALNIGITGDTRYEEGLGRIYSDCKVILLNIGSIEKEEGKLLSQHLGMLGCINLIKEARLGKPLLAILTEFGEELSGKREVLGRIIEDWAHMIDASQPNGKLKVIPADVNLEIKLDELSIRESDTHVFFPYKSIEVKESSSEKLKYKFKG